MGGQREYDAVGGAGRVLLDQGRRPGVCACGDAIARLPVPGWPDQRPYPLPFHPLELGGEALRAQFGFVVEGRPDPDDVDAATVHLHGFRVTDPSGEE